MAQYPALPLWTDAYLADTTHLTTLQHGAYLLMLMSAWRDPDCRLPDDDRHLARIARMTPATWRKHARALRAFWQVREGFLYQKRLSAERQRVDARSDSGRRAAEAKWRKSNDSADADAGAAQCESDPSISISRSISRNLNSNNDRGGKLGVEGVVGSLRSRTYVEAREIAPGHDIYYIEGLWRDWCSDKSVHDPDRAFLGFVRKHVSQNPL